MHVECDIIDYGCSVAHTKPGYIFEFLLKNQWANYSLFGFLFFLGTAKSQQKARRGAKINFQPQILDKSAALALAAVLSR